MIHFLKYLKDVHGKNASFFHFIARVSESQTIDKNICHGNLNARFFKLKSK